MEYERVLLQLDWLHGGSVPPITLVPASDPNVLYEVASAVIRSLEDHGVDRLELEICLAMLEAARELDASVMTYGENAGAIRDGLAAFLRHHRILQRLGGPSSGPAPRAHDRV